MFSSVLPCATQPPTELALLTMAQRAASSPVFGRATWQFPTKNVEGMELGNALSSLKEVAPHTKQNPK